MRKTGFKRSVGPLNASRKRVRIKRGKYRFKKTDADLKREWLVPANGYTRFTGIRGIYWYWLSRDIRKKEWEKWGGLCLTCLKYLEWEDGVCGHVVASQGCGEFLRLNPINLTLQHRACNSDRITPMAGALNAIHYDERYGQGAWDALYALRKTECKEPKKSEYPDLIRALPSYQEALLKNVENLQQ